MSTPEFSNKILMSYSMRRAIRKKARPGDIAVDNIDPVFLTLGSKTQGAREGTQIAPAEAGHRNCMQ